MAAELKTALPQQVKDVKLVKGSGGCFEVRSGRQVIFSKSQLGRFPDEGEIARTLAGASSV